MLSYVLGRRAEAKPYRTFEVTLEISAFILKAMGRQRYLGILKGIRFSFTKWSWLPVAEIAGGD